MTVMFAMAITQAVLIVVVYHMVMHKKICAVIVIVEMIMIMMVHRLAKLTTIVYRIVPVFRVLNSAYARRFQQEDAHLAMSAEQLAQRHSADPLLYARYLDAYRRSDFEAMLNYYKANYPAPPYLEDTTPVVKVRPPVLQFHGLDDTALLDDMLNGSWEWLEQDLTLVTIPDAGHWAVTERAPFVTDMMRSWLALQASR